MNDERKPVMSQDDTRTPRHGSRAIIFAFLAVLAGAVGGSLQPATDSALAPIIGAGIGIVLLFFTGMELGRSRTATKPKS